MKGIVMGEAQLQTDVRCPRGAQTRPLMIY